MRLEEEVVALRAEVANLKEQVRQLLDANAQLRAQLDKYQQEPLSFVKPNTPKLKDKAEKKRSPGASEPQTKTVPDAGSRTPPGQ